MRSRTAFDGTTGLRGIYLLKQGSAVACERLSKGGAVAAILSTAPFVNYGLQNLDLLVTAAKDLSARVPVARFSSARGSSFEEIKLAILAFQE